MRGDVSGYACATPGTLEEALAILSEGAVKPLAGGTDLMVLLAAGKLPAGNHLSLWALEELRGISVSEDAVVLGALTTYAEVQRHEVLGEEFPMLVQAASETGGLAIQNRGTLGGNIANASPAADSPPALLAYDAELELVSKGASRWVRYSDFHLGYKQTLLQKNELIARIRIARTKDARVHLYRKVGPRKAQAISKVCLAACAEVVNGSVTGARIALGGVAPITVRTPKTERVIVGSSASDATLFERARLALQEEIVPIDDVRSTSAYRRAVAGNLLRQFLEQVREAASR